MQILQEQKSALPPTPANRVTEPSKNRDVIYAQILSIQSPSMKKRGIECLHLL